MAKKTTNTENIKTETVAEFLARGGKIQKLEPVKYEEQEVNVKRTTVGPAQMMSTNSNPFSISDIDPEQFKEVLKKITNLSQEEKDKLLDMAENMSELAYQSPGLEEAALMYGEKITRKKKSKTLDNKEVDHWSSFLPDDVKKKLGL